MTNYSRRVFLKSSLAMVGAAAGSGAFFGKEAFGEMFPPTTSRPHLTFPTDPRDRISVASWPFRGYINSPTNQSRDQSKPGMDLKDFAAEVRKKFDVRNIEPLADHFASTDDGYLHDLRDAVAKAGSHIVNIPVGAKESLYARDAAARKRAVEDSKRWVDIAVVVGSPSIRQHIGRANDGKPDVELTAEGLRQIAQYGAEKNIIITLENDDLVSEDAFFLAKVIDKVNSPWLRALPDFCNSMLSGDADFNYRAVTEMFKRAYNICHVKDSEVDDGKVFRVDVAKTFAILKASGFKGYCSMEWEGGGDPYEGTRKLIEYTLKYLA